MENLISELRIAQNVNYLGVSAAILVVADFIHTFPDEVRLMWPTPRSLPKTVFFILRYYAVVHSAFGLMYELPRGLTAEQCRPRFILLAVSSILVVTLSEVILYIRVYAFSEKNKKLLAFLVVIFVGFSSVAYYIFARFIFSVEFVTFPLPNIACIPMRADGLMLGLVFSATLGSILVVMLIMIYIAYQEYWEAKGSLLTIFYRDGISYFVCLSILASANIAVNFAAPGGYRFLFIQPEVAIHAVLSTRMLLHLRAWADSRDRLPSTRSTTHCGISTYHCTVAYASQSAGTYSSN